MEWWVIKVIESFGLSLNQFEVRVGKENLTPRWGNADFFEVFGVFFPSVIGIFAGASMSGDLRDPNAAIPKGLKQTWLTIQLVVLILKILGTFLAITTTSSVYVILILCLGFTVYPYASGNISDLNNNFMNCINNTSSMDCNYGLIPDYQVRFYFIQFSLFLIKSNYFQSKQINCKNIIPLKKWLNIWQTMTLSAGYGPLIYVGIFAATVSSALGSYVCAPRIFQALCEDNLFPYIRFFAKGYGKINDPRRGYVLTFVISLAFISIGQSFYCFIKKIHFNWIQIRRIEFNRTDNIKLFHGVILLGQYGLFSLIICRFSQF